MYTFSDLLCPEENDQTQFEKVLLSVKDEFALYIISLLLLKGAQPICLASNKKLTGLNIDHIDVCCQM